MTRDLAGTVAFLYAQALVDAAERLRAVPLPGQPIDREDVAQAHLDSPELARYKQIEAEADEAGVLAQALIYRRQLESQ